MSGAFALGVLATALWAVAGFFVLERLLQAAVVPPGAPRNGFTVFLWGVAKLAIYGLAVWVLFSRPFPGMSHVVGLTIMIAVLAVIGAGARSREIKDLKSGQQVTPSGITPGHSREARDGRDDED